MQRLLGLYSRLFVAIPPSVALDAASLRCVFLRRSNYSFYVPFWFDALCCSRGDLSLEIIRVIDPGSRELFDELHQTTPRKNLRYCKNWPSEGVGTNSVYVGNGFGRLVALNRSVGTLKWELPLECCLNQLVFGETNRVFVGTGTGKLFAIELAEPESPAGFWPQVQGNSQRDSAQAAVAWTLPPSITWVDQQVRVLSRRFYRIRSVDP